MPIPPTSPPPIILAAPYGDTPTPLRSGSGVTHPWCIASMWLTWNLRSPLNSVTWHFGLTVTHRLLWNILDQTNRKRINKKKTGVSHIAYFLTFGCISAWSALILRSVQRTVRMLKTATAWSVKGLTLHKHNKIQYWWQCRSGVVLLAI